MNQELKPGEKRIAVKQSCELYHDHQWHKQGAQLVVPEAFESDSVEVVETFSTPDTKAEKINTKSGAERAKGE